MARSLKFFEPTPGGRNVVDQFLKKDLKKRPDVADALVDHLKILQQTPVATLREQRVIEYVRDSLFSARFQTSGNWVRLLLAFYPEDSDIVILLPLIKQQNKLDPGDIRHALQNLQQLKRRCN